MAPKDPDAEAEEKELTEEQKKQLRQQMEELARRQQEYQARQAEARKRALAEYSGFTATEETQKRQQAEEIEKAQQGPQQPPHDDTFLKLLARLYGIQPQSFKSEFVPILMATSVVHAEENKFLAGKFNSGGRELPVIEISKAFCMSKGKIDGELAMQMAMIALSNPDMARDGVEIKGKTEEDKLMLLAAAKLVGLKVKNEAEIKIDSEQAMQQRAQLCQQGWANLQQLATAGPAAAPTPNNRPQSPDKKAPSDPAVDPAVAAATGAAAEKLVEDKNKPVPDKNDDDKPKKWTELTDRQKDALREYYRDNSSQFDDMSDAELDGQIGKFWNGLNAEHQSSLMGSAEAAARDRKPGDKPPPTGKPVFEGLRTDDQKKLVTEYLRDQHPEYDLSDDEWEKEAAAIWNNKDTDGRSEIFKNALSNAARLEEQAARRQQEAKNNAGKTQPEPAAAKEGDSAKKSTGTAVDTPAANPILTAPPAPAQPPAPQLAPMNERKFDELLPKEKELLEADELTRRNEGKKKKAAKLSQDAQKLLEGNWDHASPDERKAIIDMITSNPDNARAALLADQARQAEQQRLLAEHGKALAKLQKDHDKAVKEFEQAMAARDPDAPSDAPALKPVEKRTFDQLLPAEKKALRNLAEATRPDKDRNKAGEMWDDPNLKSEARKERFEHATAGDANAKLRKEIEREQKKARKILAEAQARATAAAAAAIAATPSVKPADTPPVVTNPPDTTKSGPDADDGTQKPVISKAPDDPNPDASAQQPPAAAPAKDEKQDKPATPLPATTPPVSDAQAAADQTPAKVDPPKPAVTPVKGLRTFDQLSQEEQDTLWEYMTVTKQHAANEDQTPYSKQQLARSWNGIKTVAEQISILDNAKKENAEARGAIAKKQTDRNDEHSQMVAKDFSQLRLAEQYLLEQDFNKRKPEGIASAEAEWNSLDAKNRSNHITLAELTNPDLAKYLNRARRLEANIRFVPHKFADLLPEEQKLLEADFEKRKPEGVASAQAEWDAMDNRHQDFHMDRALIAGGELIGPVLEARKKAFEPKPEVKAETPAPAPDAPKPRGWVRQLLSSIWQSVFHPTPPSTPAERKEPVLTLPEKTDKGSTEPVADGSEVKPVVAEPEVAAAAPGVDEASKKKFADLLGQEQKMLLVDYLARNGSAMGNAWEQEWDSAADDTARAKLFNDAWRNQKQMHDLVIKDQEAHKTPPPPPAPSAQTSDADGTNQPIVVIPPAPPKPAETAAMNARNWDQLSSTEQDVLRAADSKNANIASDWNSWDAQTRDEMYGVALLEKTERDAKAAEASQQAVKPVVVETSSALPASPPAKPEAEKLDMPPETDTEFDAALQAKGHSRADLASMGVDQARDLIATIRREQEEAKKTAQQPPAEVRVETPPAPPVELPKQSVTSAFNITVEGVKTLPPSQEAIKILANNGFKDEKYQKAYQAIRAEVVEQQARCPGFHVSRKFLSQAANHAQLHDVLGHDGLDPREANAILECLRKEGVTTGKGPAVRDQNFGASNWDKNLATHYPSGPTANPT